MPLKFKNVMTVIFLVMMSHFFGRNIFATELEGTAIQAVKEQIQLLLEDYKRNTNIISEMQASLTISFEEANNKNIDNKKHLCDKVYLYCENLLRKFNCEKLIQIDICFYIRVERICSFCYFDLDAKYNRLISLFDTNSLDLT